MPEYTSLLSDSTPPGDLEPSRLRTLMPRSLGPIHVVTTNYFRSQRETVIG
jgi:hypothetical protein